MSDRQDDREYLVTGQASFASERLEFSNNWFDVTARSVWDALIPQINPRTVLEIGCYEGASTCYLIEYCGSIASTEIHCIDTWEGGIEHKDAGVNMVTVESRFIRNTGIARSRVSSDVKLVMHKGISHLQLASLVADGYLCYFDLIYIDGSHEAHDVLADAVFSFPTLKVGGVMIFDDYLYSGTSSGRRDPLKSVKPAVDAFLNTYFGKMQLFWSPNSQACARKLAE